jgi:formylglycine-generating enzyme required for sulfatase activity
MRALGSVALVLVLGACGAGTSTSGPRASIAGPTPTAAARPTEAAPPEPSPKRDPGTLRSDAHGVEQAWVPGGTFRMGSDEGSATPPSWASNGFRSEHPAHEVALSRGYWIDVTEVTVAQFGAFVKAGGYDDSSLWSTEGWTWRGSMGSSPLPRPCLDQQPDEPRVCVTWYEAEAFAAWRGGRLPTEAEWEFAARGPESDVYPWGDEFDPSLANLEGATGPVKVGSYPDGASWIGALDVAGNAMEWVADWWSTTYYAQEVRDDPTGPPTGSIKVEKGGWWGPPEATGAFLSRSSYRHFEDPPIYSDHHIGFRVVSPG